MTRKLLCTLLLTTLSAAGAQRPAPAYSASNLQGLCLTPIVSFWSAGKADQVATRYGMESFVQLAQALNLRPVDPRGCKLVTHVQGTHVRAGNANVLTTMLHVVIPNARVTQAATYSGNTYRTDLRTQVYLTTIQDTRVFADLGQSAAAINTSLRNLLQQIVSTKLPRP
ncbi:hypothetical protein GCM10008955_32220 [Deinococcus malanensis]|uniref:DUF302 domain-containing protein n=1 Tax=Deinococcus malanensis TaxID=1706855 RepID=A0ABQ2EZI2_9DEIO|nr:hypothetical protein [Deinococcus malanensis]GGK35823.1 hypothetical protein GCM10008955_32220 [Deinococcus malanensis]